MGLCAKFIGKYPPCWKILEIGVREEVGNKCERCGHPHDPTAGYAFTVHHLDNDKSNCLRWNLAGLCQRCHLHIQGRVFLAQFFMFEHSKWFIPHAIGYYKHVLKLTSGGATEVIESMIKYWETQR
jgi:hypothetical protein